MHFIYMETIRNPAVDWETRLAPTWAGLDERAKNFNRAILETWRRHPELIAMWLAAVERLAGSELPSQTPESAHELA